MLHSALAPVSAHPQFPQYLKRKVKDRLFFAIQLESYAGLRVGRVGQEFRDDHQLRGTPRKRELLHISLHHIGDYQSRLPSRMIFAAKRAAEAVMLPSFEVTLNAVTAFPNRESEKHAVVFLAQGAGLVDLHRGLGAGMRRIGLKAVDHFRPHVTFLYSKDMVAQQPIEPIRFVAKDFALIHSEVGLSKYNVIERWSLDAARPQQLLS